MALNLEILVGRPWSGLGGAYADGTPDGLRWFAADWREADTWRERARSVAERFDEAARARAVAALHAPTEATREKLARVAAGHGFLVTTGQQPGLFAGPCYTLYKALTAVALARWLEELLEAPVVPVFWVASDDHDWAEADHVDLLGVDNELHRIRLAPPPGAGDLPLHRLTLGNDVEAALDKVAQLLPSTDLTAAHVNLLRRAWPAGTTLDAGVRHTLAALLGEQGLAFVGAADPALKQASVPLLEAAARKAERDERGLTRRASELEASGWRPQVPILADGVNLFVEGPAGRERLYRQDGAFRLRHSGTRLTPEDLVARLREQPDTVSPNVLLRPVVEAAVLPTLGYVAGPGETAYLAQLAPLFESHGVDQPLVFPRFSVTLIEGKIARVLEKFSLEPAALARPVHELAGDLARGDVPEGVARALRELRAALERGSSELIEAARPVDPTLEGPIQHTRSVALDALGDTERKILQAIKRQGETGIQQLEKAARHLYPGGAPQERVLSPFYYLARYGTELLDGLLDRFARSMPARIPADSLAPPPGPR